MYNQKYVVTHYIKPSKLEFSSTTVWVRNNIRQTEEGLWEYEEVCMLKDDYIRNMADKQQTESELTTQIDMDVQSLTLKQNTESELLTQHDIDIFALINRITSLERRVEELEGWS